MSGHDEKTLSEALHAEGIEHAAYAKTPRNQKRMLTKNGRLIGYYTAFEAWEQLDDIRQRARAFDEP